MFQTSTNTYYQYTNVSTVSNIHSVIFAYTTALLFWFLEENVQSQTENGDLTHATHQGVMFAKTVMQIVYHTLTPKVN